MIYEQTQNNIIVTAYYIIQNKRSSDEFIEWIKNFFYLKSFKVIFTDRNTFETLFKKLYKNIYICEQINKEFNLSNYYIDTITNSLFIIQELTDTYIWKNYYNLMELSEKKDPEILLGVNHNKYLYTIWNNKSFWLKEVIDIIPAYGYYWADIGCIRYKSTPEIQQFVSSLQFVKRNDTKIILSIINTFQPEDEHYVNSIPSIYYNNNSIIRIQGGFFGGGKDELLEWCEYYIDELNQFEKYKIFAGKDQYIMGSIYLKYKYNFDIFIPKNLFYTYIYCNDIWFRFLKAFG